MFSDRQRTDAEKRLIALISPYEDKMSESYFNLQSLDYRLIFLARKAIKSDQYQYSTDESIPFSTFGTQGMYGYLTELDQQFKSRLAVNKINRGFKLTVKPANASGVNTDTIKGIYDFLHESYARNVNYVFSCQHLKLSIHVSDSSIDALCQLISVCDQIKLKALTIDLNTLTEEQCEKLTKVLQEVKYTCVRWNGVIENRQIIKLDAVNEQQRQIKVDLHHQATELAVKDISTGPEPITLAKIQALLDKKIELKPVKNKIGYQNQHHHEHAAEQKTEAKVLKSWQIEGSKEATSNKLSSGYATASNVITTEDVKAACDKTHPNHLTACDKLGEEIVGYHFKGRNLSDLWERLTGSIELTTISWDRKDSLFEMLKDYSVAIPKKISHSALSIIVQHPYLFQSGVNLEFLPDAFYFNSSIGTLFVPSATDILIKKDSTESSAFAVSLIKPWPVNLPQSDYFFQLTRSDLPSQRYFQQLRKYFPDHQAWRYWQSVFSVLNSFNQQGIDVINDFISQTNKADCLIDFFDYWTQVLNYYHFNKNVFETDVVENMTLFEYKLRREFENGLHDLSQTLIQNIPSEIRSECHAIVVKVINNVKFHCNSMDKMTKQRTRDLLLLFVNQRNTSDSKINVSPISLQQILDVIGYQNELKLLELTVTHHANAINNILSMLLDIYQVWGAIGLTDFTFSFLTPSINFVSLVISDYYQAFVDLLKLSKIEYHWWQQLTRQHTQQSGFAEFNVLMRAFQLFLTELHVLKLHKELMMPCPLQNIVNLPVGLSRVISVLKNAKKPLEQMHNLLGLEWGAFGAVCALENKKYHYVSANMQLNLQYERRFKDLASLYFMFNHYEADIFRYKDGQDFQNNDEKNIDNILELGFVTFYRYISSLKYAPSAIFYQQLFNTIKFPTQYQMVVLAMGVSFTNNILEKKLNLINIDGNLVNKQLMIGLLPIIAKATTGERCLDRLPEHQQLIEELLNSFVDVLYECARDRSSNAELHHFFQANNAVGFEELNSILKILKMLLDKKLKLDLKEIVLVLKLLKKSINQNYQLAQADNDLFHHMSLSLRDIEGFSFNYHTLVSNELYSISTLLDYEQYFIDALARIEQHNNESNFISFLTLTSFLSKTTLSLENRGRLLRILSLIHFDILNMELDIRLFLVLLKQFEAYQNKLDKKTFDTFLADLSSFVPSKHAKLLTMKTLSGIVYDALENQLSFDSLQRLYFADYRVEYYADELIDDDFYKAPAELNIAFPGLARWYSDLKKIMLQKYAVCPGDNRAEIWKQFLKIIHELGNEELQQAILQALLQSEHRGIDLLTLNNWLVVLLSKENKAVVHGNLFKSLSYQLLIHNDKKDYIDILSRWLGYADKKLTIRDHCCFIELLNSIAVLNEGTACLKNYYLALQDIYSLFYDKPDSRQQCTHILMNSINHGKLTAKTLDDLFNILILLSEAARNNKDTHLANILMLCLTNLERNYEFLLSFNQFTQDKQRATHLFLILSQVTTLESSHIYKELLKLDSDTLSKIALCYQTKTIPTDSMLLLVVENKQNVSEFVKNHICDPHHERNEDKLKKQFNDDSLWPYMCKVKVVGPDQVSDFQTQLFYQQYKFINAIGYNEIRHLSLDELRAGLHNCRDQWAIASNESKEMLCLTAISIIREVIYKTSVAPAILWPSAVQVLAILSVLNQDNKAITEPNNPLFLNISTGEGKSLISVFLAILNWIKGSSAFVVTHLASLASRDAKAYAFLFKILDIEASHLTADNVGFHIFIKAFERLSKDKKNIPDFDGIYYVDFNDLALIRQQRLNTTGMDLENVAFIIDEADKSILHNQTDNNLTNSLGHRDIHEHAWVFAELAAYLYEEIKSQPSWQGNVASIVHYLHKKTPAATNLLNQADFLSKLPIYLHAIWQARTLQEKDDFIAKCLIKNSSEYYAAVLIGDKPMPSNVTFNGLIQQALHALLNYQAKRQNINRHFKIAPETTLISSMSPEAMLSWMIQKGKAVTALSATIGSNAELLEMQLHYGFRFVKLPKMQSQSRLDYPARFCSNEKEQISAIKNICGHYTNERTQQKSRSIIISVDSIEFAEKLQLELQAHQPLMLHANLEDIDDELLAKLENEIGKPGKVLIAMGGLIARGFDGKLKFVKQLIMINTYLKDDVDEKQAQGRTGRVNAALGLRDKGKYYSVYNIEKELKRHSLTNIDDINIHPEAFKQRQYFAEYQQESAWRLHRQLIAIGRDSIQSHFYFIWNALFNNKNVILEMRIIVKKAFTDALEKIVNLLPVGDFAAETAQGTQTRQQYNQDLLAIYKDALAIMKAELGDVFKDDVEAVVKKLSHEIEQQQNQLIDKHKKTIAIGPSKANIKIYQKWKPGVKYNAYLDAGKQSTTNRLVGTVQTIFLPKANKDQLQFSKDKCVEKIKKKMRKKSLFIDQIQQVMACKVDINDIAEVDDDSNLIKIEKKYKHLTVVKFIHDPFAGKAFQLVLRAGTKQSFELLQEKIDDIYTTNQNMPPLNFHIAIIKYQNDIAYQLTIDFSSHQFDAIDRESLLCNLANIFKLQINSLFEGKFTLFTYLAFSGNECKTYASCFQHPWDSLDLIHKRKVLEIIYSHLNALTDNSLLFKQQRECFILLGMRIARDNGALTSIYQKWQNEEIYFGQQRITTQQLMTQQTTHHYFFKSPDMMSICKLIESLALPNQDAPFKVALPVFDTV